MYKGVREVTSTIHLHFYHISREIIQGDPVYTFINQTMLWSTLQQTTSKILRN